LQTKLDNDAEDNREQSTEQKKNKSGDATDSVQQCNNDHEQFDDDFAVRLLDSDNALAKR